MKCPPALTGVSAIHCCPEVHTRTDLMAGIMLWTSIFLYVLSVSGLSLWWYKDGKTILDIICLPVHEGFKKSSLKCLIILCQIVSNVNHIWGFTWYFNLHWIYDHLSDSCRSSLRFSKTLLVDISYKLFWALFIFSLCWYLYHRCNLTVGWVGGAFV